MTNYNANYPTGVYVIHCEVCETINQLVIIAIIAGIRTFTTISIQNYWYGSHCFAGNNGVLARTRLARIKFGIFIGEENFPAWKELFIIPDGKFVFF